MTSRRDFLNQLAATGLATSIVVRPLAALAQDDPLATLVRTYAGSGAVKEGRVKLDIAPLVDNGNSVPIDVNVTSPMTATDRVIGIAVFNEKNPQPEVAEFTLGPRAGRAHVATRIRMATTQRIVAVAKMQDGSYWTHTVEVVVTLAACLDD